MIPLHDNVRSSRFAIINLLLILANFAVFMHELSPRSLPSTAS